MNTDRLLLCRPMGGLTDLLCQIENACRYAEKFGRTVVVDTNYQSDAYFRDAFSNYFVSRQSNLVLNAESILPILDDIDVFPNFLTGRASRYAMRFDRKSKRFIDIETRRPVSFDFDKDYRERLIVHHASGRGSRAIDVLSRIRIHDRLLAVLLQRLTQIGPRYTGIHVRDTDYRTRYQGFIPPPTLDRRDPIFIGTDNRDAVAYFRSAFGSERVYSFARLPDVPGEVLHHIADVNDAYERNRDSILDLLMLGLSTDYYMFEIEPNPYGARFSGFSVLAAELNEAKPVLRRLISDDESALGYCYSWDAGDSA